MVIAGKQVNFRRVHGRQFVKLEGSDWQEYMCVKANLDDRIEIRVTDTIPVEDQFNLVAEEVAMLKPNRGKRKAS